MTGRAHHEHGDGGPEKSVEVFPVANAGDLARGRVDRGPERARHAPVQPHVFLLQLPASHHLRAGALSRAVRLRAKLTAEQVHPEHAGIVAGIVNPLSST